MLCNGCIRANLVLLHQADQIWFCQQLRGRCASWLEFERVWYEFVALDKLWDFVAIPSVIGVDFEVVSLQNDQAFSIKVFRVHLDLHSGFVSKRIFPAAAEEPTHNELIHPLLVSIEASQAVFGGVDGRMCLVISSAVAGSFELAVSQAIENR